ncbi:DUF6927 domain-containing protein [Microbacterium sp. NPDC016588]|uniref:DUF6927 domain-containing protein n=1 Tax=Microbacterium TaxID=33882 RepID=UPI0007F3FA1D|nr:MULTISPECIES: hypothetical protein [unclassified Microbacterium]OAN36365.1 hypothetical protein A4X16_17090 [Microbacterium sp. H83]TCJ21222.1 hypothetical protein E0W80_17380 [Microbacterium sp. PI-1]
MGATSTHKQAGVSVRDYFADYFTNATIIASGTRRDPDYLAGSYDWPYEFYAAVRYNDGHPHAGEVFAFVALYSTAPRSHYNFTYKDMDETMGPGASHAPHRVLEALTPTTHEHAQEWRARCWGNLELAEAKPRVRRGDRIRFAEDFTFSGGLQTTTETVFEIVERDVLRLPDHHGMRVKIPRWRARSFALAAS